MCMPLQLRVRLTLPRSEEDLWWSGSTSDERSGVFPASHVRIFNGNPRKLVTHLHKDALLSLSLSLIHILLSLPLSHAFPFSLPHTLSLTFPLSLALNVSIYLFTCLCESCHPRGITHMSMFFRHVHCTTSIQRTASSSPSAQTTSLWSPPWTRMDGAPCSSPSRSLACLPACLHCCCCLFMCLDAS